MTDLKDAARSKNSIEPGLHLPDYVGNANFYIRWARYGHKLPSLEIQNPLHPERGTVDFLACPERRDLRNARFHGLIETLLYFMRGLDFIGKAFSDKDANRQRHRLIWKHLRIDEKSVAHRKSEPGALQYFMLARFKVSEKVRTLGRDLRYKTLVTIDAEKRLHWKPACDCFQDPAWIYNRSLPLRSDPSIFPAAPRPGFLLLGPSVGLSVTSASDDAEMEDDGGGEQDENTGVVQNTNA